MSEVEGIPKAKRRLRFWYVVGVVLVLAILAFVIFRLAGRTKLEGRLDAMRAAGYPVTLVELDAWYEAPPYGENAADYIIEALAYLQQPDPEQKGQIPWLGNAKTPARTEPFDAETAAIVAQLLQDNQDAIRLLQEAATHAHSRYPVDFTKGHATLLPHLSNLRSAAQLLCLKATLHGEQEQQDSTTDALVCAFSIANSQAAEPLLISQMVRHGSQATALSALERIVNQVNLEQEHLARLGETIAKAYDPNTMARAFAGERCMVILSLRDPRATGLELAPIIASEGPSLLQIYGAQALGVVDRYLVRYIDHVDRHIAALRLPAHERLQAATDLERQDQEIHQAHTALSYFMTSVHRFILNDLAHMTRLRVAGVAMAIEQYRLANGTLPERLADLVPTFLPDVPLDPYDGQPLRYRRLERGYVVYSIGKDLTDDGGKERVKKRRGKEEPPYDITFIVER